MPRKKDSELRDRVIGYIKNKGMSVRAFEESMGLPNGSISQYTDNTSKDTLKRISETYPDFDVDFIITGKKTNIDTIIYNQPIPYEFVQAMIDERKRHDEMNAELIRQNGELISHLKEVKKGAVQEDVSCATAESSGLVG